MTEVVITLMLFYKMSETQGLENSCLSRQALKNTTLHLIR